MKNKLKVLRAERDWSQAELAERVGVSRQTIIALEREKYDPSLPLAFRLAEVFNKKIEGIFVFKNPGWEGDGDASDHMQRSPR